ncbi:HAD family phosphatase [Pseudaminobacter arsenicus]|uniref:HAD family phosphatase n=1 Tax=Borborobacter arsenicus TaxID=1851146 RepID=A0A432V2Y3_9HYPH|nr:HAD family phosphatase [Pseudaminobacter arsenicus]RUM96557.1 HAD family phosphatase [Pseudaminobacter arsenicus]
MTPKAVYWDMDGTLIDSEPLHEQAMAAVLTSLGITPPADLHDSIIGISAMPIYEMLRDTLGLRLSFDDWIVRKYVYYMEHVSRLTPRAGAVETFRDLRAQGVPQAVVSNSDRLIVEANMRVIGIDKPGMKSVTRNDVRLGKPDPEPYLRAAWLTGIDPAKSFVVEDTITGSLAGLAAGMRTLFWPQQPMEPPAGAILVTSAEDLKRHLGVN